MVWSMSFFIDDFSHYVYIFLIIDKSSILEVFKIYETEVDN